jgi:hypothetical protein
MRKSQGSGQMYSNINAGLAALAPEINPMDTTDTGFGARNRAAGLAGLETTYGPMLKDQRDSMTRQKEILANKPPEEGIGINPIGDGYPDGKFVTFGSQGQGSTNLMNMGGIAALAQGGYPRRNGQINGPGTEKSDSIPAMLSDGEFVMTAKAVRGAGKGSRRAGAKKMYALMHQLEKNSERG